MKKFAIGTKQGMSQLFTADGKAIAVTVIHVPQATVTQLKSTETDGYRSVQLGSGEVKTSKIKKPQRGHLKEIANVKNFREFKPEDDKEYKRGDKIGVDIFEVGDQVSVSGSSIGRGFQGVVKRHGFAGGPASHGHRHVLRAPGSIGSRFPQHTRRGTRMAGRMGGNRVTIKNLEVVRVDKESEALFLKGAIPGKKGTLVEISMR